MEDLALWDLFFASIPVIILYLLIDWLLHKPRITDVQDKYIFITGCDSGFGRAAALKFDKMGCHVFAGCLNESTLMEIQAEASDRLIPMKVDVSRLSNMQAMCRVVTQLIPEGRGLWGLINNAGMTGPLGPYAWLSEEDVRSVLDVNIMGMINMVNTFLPLLKQAKGRVVNVSSILGLFSTPYAGAYPMSKYAVEAYSDGIRRELYMFGIRVSIVEPGGHFTNFLHKVPDNVNAAWDKLPKEMQEEYGYSYFQKVSQLGGQLIPFLATKTPDGVLAAYDHALFAKIPRIRYPVGKDAKLLSLGAKLPAWMHDMVLNAPFVRAVPECLNKKDK